MQVCSVFCLHTSFENVPQHIMVSSIQSHRILEYFKCAKMGQFTGLENSEFRSDVEIQAKSEPLVLGGQQLITG